ncbi:MULTISPECIES: class E sortase [unclassified Streptomyces]|uniref:class E sortase n=1 Tax=unclassified Streptomyces TaxID=2593676 RepID=UPI001BE8035E|nr:MULTISPECIES: class E sortase [unclassified Streptomyces]MBT2404097.1 class E sortase [Streptomyces sp. ISL-21]MBT2454380.1 class E sortase [Streptomyces sp. ISL-86]MBT2607858.1 class E sortase [Streptomyces sp. ISL-87]
MRSPWPPRPRPRRIRPDVVLRLVVRTFSEVCLTVGTLIVLFVAYVLLWTGVKADRAMDGEMARLRDRWAASAPAPAPSSRPSSRPQEQPAEPADPPAAPPADPPGYPGGQAFAEMYIPRFGPDWNKPVLEGTGTELLKKGLGHYEGTARLGAAGNFSVAGHRRTYGDPFKDFPELRPGDAVILKDAAGWYTYTVRNAPLRTLPTEVGVVDPVPRRSPFTGPGRYLTLTTCDPEWGHSHRLVVWAELTGTRPVSQGRPEGLRG